MNLLPHTAGRVFNTPLMISRAKLDTILNVVVPRMEGDSLPAAALPESREYEVSKEGIAVIPVVGTLVRRTVGLEAQSGLTSYTALEEQLNAALNDNSIKGILLDIDSPGGESGGVFDFADKIYAACRIKPIYAVVNEDAFSAAYVIAAAAQRIYIPRTGGAGSLGVIAVHLDESKAEEDAGLTYTAVYAGARKNDLSPHEPLSDPARAHLQAEVDRVYQILTRTVSRLRGLDEEWIKSTEAGLYFGENALKAGLADQIGTFGDALKALARKVSKPAPSRSIAEYPEDLEDDDFMTALMSALDDEDEEESHVRKCGRAKRKTMQDDEEEDHMAYEDDEEFEDKDETESRRRSRRARRRASEHDDDDDDAQLEGEEAEEEEDAPLSRRSRKARRRAEIEEEDEEEDSYLEAEEGDEEEDEPASRRSRRARRRRAEQEEEDEDDPLLELDDEEEEEETPASRRRARRKAMSRKARRKKAFSYLAAVNELCLLAGRPDRAAAFIAKAVPLSVVRKTLLNARAAQDEATAIMGYAAPRTTTRANEPKIDTAAIYAKRNRRSKK